MNTNTAAPVLTLAAIAAELADPFPLALIDLKPGATNKDRDNPRCLAMPYADMRAYESRLDEIAGVEHWATSYTMTARGVVCALTICGVTKSGIGDYPADAGDENAATSAQAQAFKRACASFGLGRYLYSLPSLWCDYDPDRRQIKNPDRVRWEMYRKAGPLTTEEAKKAPPVAAGSSSGGR
jgi:hypothetical protein